MKNKSYDDFLHDIMGEIDTNKDIVNFFKKNDLEFVDVNLGKKILRVYYNSSKNFVYQILNGEKEELGVGTKRYKVPNLLKKILAYLNNMSESDIEIEKAKPEVEKYNL